MRLVITTSKLGSRLGPTKDGVRVLLIGLGEDACELELPYLKLCHLPELVMPADWTRPSSGVRLRRQDEEADPAPTPSPARLTKDLAAKILKGRD